MATKTLTIKFYDVDFKKVEPIISNFQKLLKEKLSDKNIDDRSQIIHINNENRERYTILSYEEYNDTIFGIYIKLSEENSIHMPNEGLKKNSIFLEDLIQYGIDDQAGIVKSYSYFCIYNKVLLFTSPRFLKSFERYINWLFGDKENSVFFTPKLCDVNDFKISNIKNIEIKESYFSNTNDTNKNNVKNSFKTFLSSLFNESKTSDFNIDNIDIEELLSYKISLKMNSFKHKNKDDKIENILKATIRNISSENVVITTKDNKIYKGNVIERKSTISIDISDETKLPDSKEIKKRMYSEIKNLSSK